MKYAVELYRHAVSCSTLAQTVACTIYPHIRDTGKTQEENQRSRMDLAHSWLNSKDISKPFLLGVNLYYPITVVTEMQTTVYGYFYTVVGVTNPTGIYFHPLSEPADAAREGLKISAQTTKLVKGSEVARKMLTTANWRSYFNHAGHRRGNKAFRCKPEEIVKALALGYLKIDTNGASFKQQLNHANRVKSPPPVPPSWDTTSVAAYKDYQEASKIPKVTHRFYEEGKIEERNDFLNFIEVCTNEIQRTSLEMDPKTETKWRKASKNSMWPYTLDHHWFNAQEGRISVAHHAFKSLMHGGRGTFDADKIQINLPIFTCIKTLERTRKILEHFFSSTSKILGNKANHEFSQFVSSVNDLEWPSRKYSQKIVSPEMFPVIACLALEVIPLFDKSGQFTKFVKIDNNLSDNKRVIYYEVDPHNLTTRRPEITFLLAYSTGLITLEDLETVMGINRNTMTAETTGYAHLRLSKNIVLCFPIEYALTEVKGSFARQNLVMYPEAESEVIVKALDQIEELDEYSITNSDD